MINNIDKILPLLHFKTDDDFYFLEIIKRRKENPDNKSNARVIKSFYIYSKKFLIESMPDIIKLCELENARAYINLNRRSFEQTAFQTLKKITDCIISKDFRSCKKAYNSSCGSFSAEKDKKWIVDIDVPIEEIDWDMVNFINLLQSKANNIPLCEFIPTKNGYHIITRPFNKQEFSQKYQGIDIQTNSPTLLYI